MTSESQVPPSIKRIVSAAFSTTAIAKDMEWDRAEESPLA